MQCPPFRPVLGAIRLPTTVSITSLRLKGLERTKLQHVVPGLLVVY